MSRRETTVNTGSKEYHRAFGKWLRTGFWAFDPAAEAAETKYNHWHDPRSGRFTFAGAGRHDGSSEARTRGRHTGGGGSQGSWDEPGFDAGGGNFGGGGARGTWQDPVPDGPRRQSRTPEARPASARPAIVTTRPSQSSHTLPAPTPYRLVTLNGYRFSIDKRGRTHAVEGEIQIGMIARRSRPLQREAGKPDRRATDDGGHYIAARFNGPREAFNHFAQDANFNRGRYRVLEDQLAKLKQQGKTVPIRIVPHFQGASKRPYEIDVVFWVDGHQKSVKFPNGLRKVGHD